MATDLQREILFFQSLAHDEKVDLLSKAGLLNNEDAANEETMNEIIANNIELLQGEPIATETTEPTNLQTGTVETTATEIETPATENTTVEPANEALQAEKQEQPIQTPAKPKNKAAKQTERLVITIGFSGESAEYVRSVIEEHIKEGLCSNNSDFGTKAFDFAINLGCFTGKQLFGVPANHEYKLLKNGFADFVNATPKITVCK